VGNSKLERVFDLSLYAIVV